VYPDFFDGLWGSLLTGVVDTVHLDRRSHCKDFTRRLKKIACRGVITFCAMVSEKVNTLPLISLPVCCISPWAGICSMVLISSRNKKGLDLLSSETLPTMRVTSVKTNKTGEKSTEKNQSKKMI
jgi:hypothetical protein